jgi:hypothetical protein
MREGAMAEVGQGLSPQGGAARGWAAPPGGEATLWPLSPPPSGFFSLLVKYNFLVFSRSSKYGVLMVLFPAES